jgi:hypothetical protein
MLERKNAQHVAWARHCKFLDVLGQNLSDDRRLDAILAAFDVGPVLELDQQNIAAGVIDDDTVMYLQAAS